MAKVCFLFNHDQVHQVAHSLPLALAMARNSRHELVLATSNDRIAEHLRLAVAEAETPLPVVMLDLTAKVSRLLARATEWLVPARKILMFRDNLDFFRQFDAVVTSEKTSLLLKDRYGLDQLKIIHTRHGAGDRAIGFGKESARFDLVLVSGPKIARRLETEAGLDPARIRVIGYPKFDLYADCEPSNPFRDPTRPTVLYAPHPSPRLSSYYRMGETLLRKFAASDRFNLVFAPHAMMYRRNFVTTISPPAIRRVPQVPAAAREAEHILIDTGSPALSDMTYTNLADVFIGDVSSQVYEFLQRPRPVLHLDAHRVDWQDNANFAHWRAGPVTREAEMIIAEVERAIATHGDYLPIQRAMLADTFAYNDGRAAERGAAAIAEFLERRT